MAGRGKPLRFVATLYKVEINRCVDVPEVVGEALGGQRYLPVVATIHGHSIRTTLVPGSGGRYRLFLNGQMRKAAGVDTGEAVGLVLRVDTQSRETPIPIDLAKALRSTKGGRAAFQKLTPGLRREFLRWVLNAKRPETRERRIRKGIGILLEMAARKSQKRSAS